MGARPRSRSEGIIVERLNDGLVIYDVETNQAHSLDASSTRVWVAADGHRTVAEIGAATGLGADGALAALDQLEARGLLLQQPVVSRRSMLKRTALVGAAAVGAAPLIETVVIPTAAAHASTGANGGGPPPYTGTGPYEQDGVFYVPAGYTVTFSALELDACDPLTIGYAVGGVRYPLANNSGNTCGPYYPAGTFSANGGAPFTSNVQLVTYLEDDYNGNQYIFYSNDPSHAVVQPNPSPSGDAEVLTTDSYFGQYPPGTNRPVNTPPGAGDYNGKITVTISP